MAYGLLTERPSATVRASTVLPAALGLFSRCEQHVRSSGPALGGRCGVDSWHSHISASGIEEKLATTHRQVHWAVSRCALRVELFNCATLQRDLARAVRFYRARGYDHAQVSAGLVDAPRQASRASRDRSRGRDARPKPYAQGRGHRGVAQGNQRCCQRSCEGRSA